MTEFLKIENLPVPLFTVDKNGRITGWNKMIEDFTGYTADQMLGKSNFQYALPFYGERRPMLVDLIISDDVIAQKHYSGVKKEGQFLIYENENVLVNGQRIALRAKAGPLYDREGRIIGAIQTVEDISDKIKALDYYSRYNAVFNNIRDAALVMENDGRIIEVNQAALDAYGYSREELLSLNFADLGGQSTGEVLEQTKPAESKPVLYQTIHSRKNGSKFLVEIGCAVAEHNNKKMLVCIISDITQKKKNERIIVNTVQKLKKTLNETIHSLSLAVEKRDPYTAGHQQRVARIAEIICRRMHLTENVVESVRTAAILHDIGKIVIPAEILAKPTKLTDIEMSLIQTHSETGYEIIKDIPFDKNVALAVLQHHERINGSGYPKGLKEEEIILEAKILAVADTIEAMASHRSYRSSLGIHQAISELIENKGILYDPEVVDICWEMYQNGLFQGLLMSSR